MIYGVKCVMTQNLNVVLNVVSNTYLQGNEAYIYSALNNHQVCFYHLQVVRYYGLLEE